MTPQFKTKRRQNIRYRIRRKISGIATRPRLSIYRSNADIYAQLIDDATGKTLASAGSFKQKEAQNVNKITQATMIGKEIAEKARLLAKRYFDIGSVLINSPERATMEL